MRSCCFELSPPQLETTISLGAASALPLTRPSKVGATPAAAHSARNWRRLLSLLRILAAISNRASRSPSLGMVVPPDVMWFLVVSLIIHAPQRRSGRQRRHRKAAAEAIGDRIARSESGNDGSQIGVELHPVIGADKSD